MKLELIGVKPRISSQKIKITNLVLTPMYNAQVSEGVLGACMLKIPSDPCALYIGVNVRWGFWGRVCSKSSRTLGRACSKPPQTLPPMYKAEGSEGVLGAFMLKTPSDFAPMYKVEGSEGVLGRACSKPPRTLLPMYKEERVRGGFGPCMLKTPSDLASYV